MSSSGGVTASSRPPAGGSTLDPPSHAAPHAPGTPAKEHREICVLAVCIFVTSVCAIVYQLLVSSLSSYLLGSSVLHFSLTIGLFLFFMGAGAFVSKFIRSDLEERFVCIETAIGLLGGAAGLLLYLSFSISELYYLCAFILIAAISTLIGLEIPLVTRILQRYQGIKDALANILAVDYFGALLASLLFPLVFLPYLGLMRTGFLVGMLNIGAAAVTAVELKHHLVHYRRTLVLMGVSMAALTAGFIYSFALVGFFEQFIYQDPIVYSAQTPYQRIVVTQYKDDLRLYLNGSIQFSSIDEHRYHESLVHPALSALPNRSAVLLLGAGDGLALREVLKYPDVTEATLVDIDLQMLEISRSVSAIRRLNGDSLQDPRVRVVVDDAFEFLERDTSLYSAVIIDLPDPDDLTIGKLYSKEFYELVKKRLSADGIVVTQSSSPYFAREPFWSIHATLASVFDHVVPYQTYIPSFGPWGFNAASNIRYPLSTAAPKVPTRYLTEEVLPTLFVFDSDADRIPAEVNHLDTQSLVRKYEQSWDRWN